jgi:hypothetical protein
MKPLSNLGIWMDTVSTLSGRPLIKILFLISDNVPRVTPFSTGYKFRFVMFNLKYETGL